MTIRIRRGLYDDFDSTKMLPGEWAVAIDSDTSKQVVWMCFAPGVVKRMGTYEDFKQQIEEATAEIKDEYLTEFQAILDQIDKLAETTQSNTDTVIQIRDTTVDTYLPQMLKYLENAQAASKTATEQATSASTSATNAKTSETLAKSYMERAFSATPEGYDALVDNVNMLDTQTTTDATLYGSKPGGLRVNHMVGYTEQKTLSGKNLVNVPDGSYTINDVSVSISGGIVSVNGTPTLAGGRKKYIAQTTLPSGTYTISLKEKTGTLCTIAVTDVANSGSAISIFSNIATFTLANETTIGVGINVVLNNSYNGSFKIQIEAGEVETDYEPYCGGTPSPNPDFPQAIENVGDCVEMISGAYSTTNGIAAGNSQALRNKHKIPCKNGDVIVVDNEVMPNITVVSYYDENNNFISFKMHTYTTNEMEVTVAESKACYFNFHNLYNGSNKVTEAGKITLTINGKHVVQIVEHGKNILGGLRFANALVKSGANVNNTDQINKTVTLIGTSQSSNKTIFSNFKSDTQYTIFFRGFNSSTNYPLKTNLRIGYTDGTTTLIDFAEGKAHTLYVTKVGKSIDSIFSVYDTGSANFYYEDFGIMEGVHTLEDFEPYTESTATILLDEPLRATDRLVRKDGVINENHRRVTVAVKDLIVQWFDVNANNRATVALPKKSAGVFDSDINKSALCSHFGYNPTVYHDSNNTVGFAINGSNLYFRFGSMSEINTLELFNEWVTNNNPIIEYTLAKETFTPLDTASQIAINSLKTFDTVTHITVDSVTQPAELEVEFGKSKVGARVIKNENDNDIDRIERKEMKAQLNELATALVAVGSEV